MNKNTGFYGETMPLTRQQDGRIMSVYRDAGVYFDEAGMRTERQMRINGQTFFVTSVFPMVATATPTEKIIKLIDLDVMKKAE
ncbi:hypothetical protein [Lacrimispora saccharolytica]|uniref:Uncharacterized protein n=1 Tax=Lacrimispora saccharolytica (strain ATCC 35040 / DSM 2544 / NRCC 2533 / WM1) TaxID=610130 RepID=D9R0E6_LACSW|nr:hypothetical protein [Lacrimispora saccharolytica]ADL06379.1 hypothetical protein Closa_3864 [[Clostridium] saccharolyticum WM1]QRV19527.1 hypothetical protein I6K70_19140 [Lacrimispora saccharolytica]